MQTQMMVGQALEHYAMMDFANLVLEQCWDICYNSQLTRPELASGELPDVKVQKMDACARKCVARHFEVLTLLSATRELREKERMQGLPPGALTNTTRTNSGGSKSSLLLKEQQRRSLATGPARTVRLISRMTRQLTLQLRQLIQSAASCHCLNLLWCAVTGNSNALRATAAAPLALRETLPLLCASQPRADETQRATEVLLLRAAFIAEATLPESLGGSAGVRNDRPPPDGASAVDSSALAWACRATPLSERCATSYSVHRVCGPYAPLLILTATRQRRVHTADGNSDDSAAAAITDRRARAHRYEIAAYQPLLERVRRRTATVRRHQRGGISRIDAGMRGVSSVHAFRAHCTVSRTPTLSHHTARMTRGNSTSAAASLSFSSCVASEKRWNASEGWESSSSAAPSSSSKPPRVTRRLAAAWQRACDEAYGAAQSGRLSSSASDSSRRTWSFSAEEELRALFRRALLWRSDASPYAVRDSELVAEMVRQPMVAFVVETYVALREKLERFRSRDTAPALVACNSSTSSELRWQLLALLVLADEVCVALGDSNADPARTSCRLSEDTNSSVVNECIVVVTAVQLCALKHMCCQISVAGVMGTGTGHNETNPQDATAVAPHSAHAVRATRRLVESLLTLCKKEDEGAALSSEKRNTSGVCSLDSWVGQQLCCLDATSCCSLHAVRGHKDQDEAFSAPLLLLLRLLVQSTPWLILCSAADVHGAQHLRQVCAAVLLIERVVECASEDEQPRCIDKLRHALQLPHSLVRQEEEVDGAAQLPTPTSPRRARCHSRSFDESARAEGVTAPLPAATGCFVCHVLDGCPTSISRLLLLSWTPSQLPHSTTGSPEKLVYWELVAKEVVMLLAPGMALSTAWRRRHSCTVGSMLRTSTTASAKAFEYTDAANAGAAGCAGSTAPLPRGSDAAAHCLLLQRRNELKQVCSRFCAFAESCTLPSPTAAASLLPWWQALSSPFLCSILSQLESPAVARIAEAVLETLTLRSPSLSAVPYEGNSTALQEARATSLKRKGDESGEVVGAMRCRLPLLTLQGILASVSEDAARAELAQALLSRFCTALTKSARTSEGGNVDLTRMRVHGAGLCLAILLACASTSLRDQTAATHQLLTAFTSLVAGGEHSPHSRRDDDDVYAVLCSWWPGALGGIMLARHAQLARGASRCVRSAPVEPRSGETPYRDPFSLLSPASQFAAWWEGQPYLREACYWAETRMRRLCNAVAYLAATSATTFIASSPEQLPSLPALSIMDAGAAKVACTAGYDALSLEHLCHLALASAALPLPEEKTDSTAVAVPSATPARSSTSSTNLSCVCALVTTGAGAVLFDGDLSAEDGMTSIFRHARTPAQWGGDGVLSVLQHRQGRPLTDRQHESLVEALRDFSRRRCVHEAVALFYAHERQHRRLRLAEVELFAETAKRAPLPFLVRVLLYVPPPCESAVLARAIIAGAWRAYQRALRRHSRRVTAAAVGERPPGGQRVTSSLASRIRRQSRRRVEQAWYESLAVVRRALALFPSAEGTDRLSEEQQRHALSILQRLVYARPRSMQPPTPPQPVPSSSMRTAGFVDEWDSCAVQSAQLLAALLRSSSSSKSQQSHHELWDASMRHSVRGLDQIIQFCDTNGDSATAVRAYLRFANSHASSSPHSRRPSSAAHEVAKQSSETAHADYGQIVPLLSVNMCVSLLRLASMHVSAVCDDSISADVIPATAAASSTPVPLATLVAYVEEGHELSEEPAPEARSHSEAPRGGAALMQKYSGSLFGGDDAEMKIRTHSRAVLEENAATPSNIVTEATAEIAILTSKPARNGTRGSNGHHVDDTNTFASVATAARAGRGRVMAYALNSIAAVERLSPTLPTPLRCVLHSDTALIPLTAVLHDALRWCRLRPRSMPAREGATMATDGLDAASLHLMVDRANSDDPAAVDVVAQLIAAMFQLDDAEICEMIDVTHLHPVPSLVETAEGFVAETDAAASMAKVEREEASSLMVVTRRTFVCRAAYANLDFWRLVRHTDVLLSYIWDYVWELYRLESTVLWVSPAQQQRAYLAVAECAQVIVAALQALDVWAVEMRAHEVREGGHNGNDGEGGSDHQVDEQASLTAARSSVRMASSSDWELRSEVDGWRIRLRSGTLQRVVARMLGESDLPDTATGRRGEAAPAILAYRIMPWGTAYTTSAAIAHVTTVIQHSRRAFESCAPSNVLMQLAVDAITGTSAASSDTSLAGGVMTQCATPSQGVRELLSVTTQQYYDILGRLVSVSLLAIDGTEAFLPAHLSSLVMDSLSYVLHCVTFAAVSPRQRQTIATVAEPEAGSMVALLARVAATEGVLRHTASLVQRALVHIEVTDAAPHTVNAQLFHTLRSLSAAFQYAAVLLDECMARWTLLDLEAATAAAPPSDLLGASDACCRDCDHPFTSASVSLVTEGVLAHLRVQLKRLAVSFVDLYASGWCGGVHARLPEVARARLWSRDELRAQHLHVCLTLRHLTSASGDAAVSARLMGAAEALEQALARHPSASFIPSSRRGTRRQLSSDFIDMDAFVLDSDENIAEAAHRTAMAATRTLERILLAYLTLKKRGTGVTAGTPDQIALVSITAMENSFQRAAMSQLPPSQVALLWRLFPALIDDGCHAPGAFEETPDGVSGDVPYPMPCESSIAEERRWSAMCAVPRTLWRHLVRLGGESESAGVDGALFSGSAHTEASVMPRERLAMYAALLSQKPLVLMGVVRHPLVRHHQLAETQRTQCQRGCIGAGSDSDTDVSKGPSCEWLKKLLLYSAEDDAIAEARLAVIGEAGGPVLPTAETAASSTLSQGISGASLRTSSRDSLAFLFLQPLREQFVSALILSVLRDASLICVHHLRVSIAAASNSADGATAPAPSRLQPSSSVYPLAAETLMAQRREDLLLELLQHLGYVAPHALGTAFRWITGTPYPPETRTQLSPSFPAEAVPQDQLKCSTLSCADATLLRRLRVALLSCGPWPTDVARPLLEYATRAQAVASEETAAKAHASDGHTTAVPFPEALELYHRLRQQPEKGRNNVAAASSVLTVTAQLQLEDVRGVRIPILRRVLQHYRARGYGDPLREREDRSDASASCCRGDLSASRPSRKTSDSLPRVQRRGNRFLVGSSTLRLPAAAAPTCSVYSISGVDGTAAAPPLSAIQLACEEGACLVNALRAVDAPDTEGAAARIALRMRDLATAPSYAACARLLTDDAFATDVMGLPMTRVAATLLFAWRTLLLRAAELDCRELDWVSGDGVVAAQVRRPARKPQRRGGGCKDCGGMAALGVYAMFFLVASRMYDRLSATVSPSRRPKTQQWLVREQCRLRSLKQEVAAYWVAAWADEVMASETVLNRSTTSEAEAICSRIDKYCRSGADGGAMLCPTLGLVSLWEHLRRAQAGMQTSSHERSASCSSLRTSRSSGTEDCSAAAELSRVHQEVSAHLRDAWARMALLPRSITAEASSTPEGADVRVTSEQAWSLWPPVASETYRLRASMRESLTADTLGTVTVRNPLSVVAYLRTWQRERAPSLERRRSGTRTVCVLLPAVCLQSFNATRSGRRPAAPRKDAQRVSQSTSVSLMDVWRAVDAFGQRGYLVLVCIPRGGHGQAARCGLARGSGGGSVQADALQGDLENTAAGASPAGAGVVMQAFFEVVSLEDARLQKERQQRRRQCAGPPFECTRSGDILVLLSVLRQLRQRLLPPSAGTAPVTAPDEHGSEVASPTWSAKDKSGLALAASLWTTFVPISHPCIANPPPTHRSGESSDAVTNPSSLAPSRDGTAWHAYLHVLHLCGDGLLYRVAQRRERRASPSAAILTHVAHQLQRLLTLSSLEEQAAHPSVSSAFRSCLLNDQDSERIICFQIRGLQRIRASVNMLGWTVEQHMELQLAQQNVVATVAAVCALQRRSHRDQESSLGERARRTSTAGCAELSTRPPKRVAAGMREGHVNQVEQATAACFYPGLAHLLRQLSVTYPRSRVAGASPPAAASPSRLRFPVMDRTPRAHGATTEVVTTFGGAAASPRLQDGSASFFLPQKIAASATAESDRVAATLLATINGALCEARGQASSLTHRRRISEAADTYPAPTPLKACRERHAFLSAVVAAVQRRSRDADPRLLLNFLNGRESEALRPLGASAEAAFLEMLMEAVTLAGSACSTAHHRHRIVEAGLTLYALLRPWLPLAASARETCAMEAALCLVTLALQLHKPFSDTTGTETAVESPATSLPYLLQTALVDIVHCQQSTRLSVRSIVLLGVIYSQLRDSERERGTMASTMHTRRSSCTVPQAEARVLLWRILSALSALSEKDAAEVRDAWVAECEASIGARGTSAADDGPARVTGNAAPPSVSDTVQLPTEIGSASAHVHSGASVIEVLYHGSLQVLAEGVGSDGAAEAEGGRWRWPLLLAATRLRTWLGREEAVVASHLLTNAYTSDSAAEVVLHPSAASRLVLPQLRVLEDLLCGTLDGWNEDASGASRCRRKDGSPFGGDKRGRLATRRNWLACLCTYSLYAELKHACLPPPWGGKQCFQQSHARSGDGDGSQHHDGGSRYDGDGTCIGDVASLLLELAVVAALSAAESAPPCQHASAVSDARQLALLSTFVSCCDSLGTPLPILPCPPQLQRWGLEHSRATPVAAQVAPPASRVLACVSVDAHAAVRHLATRLLCRLAEVKLPSALPASPIFHHWRDMLTPLQALRRVATAFPPRETEMPEGDEGGDGEAAHGGVWLLSSLTAGLQWARKCHEHFSFSRSVTGLEASRSDVDHAGCTLTAPSGQQVPHSQRHTWHDEQSLRGMYYATLRLLCRTKHLLVLPPPVLLKELLCPLAELERAAADAATLFPTTAEATPCAAKPTAQGCDDSAAGRNRVAADRLAGLADVAQRVSAHPALRESAAVAGQRSGDDSLSARWTTAWLVFKALAQVEEAIVAQCETIQSSRDVGGRAVRATAALLSPSRIFAARYADLLAQRGTYAPDYLAFLLVVSHHYHGLLPMHENALRGAPQADEERLVRLRYSQLCHVVALAVPPSAVGAAMQLFQLKPSLHPLSVAAARKHSVKGVANASAAAVENSATNQLSCAHAERGTGSCAGRSQQRLTPDAAALLHRLHRLLQTARGK